MGIEQININSSEVPKKKFEVLIEMEGWGKNGDEIIDDDSYEKVEVEAVDENEAEEIVFNQMDFGNRIPNCCLKVKEVGKLEK